MISFKDCASYYEGEPHQDEAWEYLQQNVTEDILEKFALIFRNQKVETAEEPSVTSADGIDLIKSFEGLKLEAYICPAGVLTIGYGHTGPDVYRGLTITEEKAEQLLVQDLHRFERAVREMIGVPFTQHEFDATVSFTYNCGEGALSSSTFRRRINSGEDKATCFREEFPRWTSGGMPGLVRRREAEVELATS